MDEVEAGASACPTLVMVDDDVELCGLVSEYLGAHGFDVRAAHDGASGLRRITEGPCVLVLLDVMLPLVDGFEVLRQIRKRSDVPVIMLTARAAEADRVRGFGTGVDDYLVKPFAAAELLGRVRAVLRRASGGAPAPERLVRLGDLTLDTAALTITWRGAPIELTPTEFTVLEVLAHAEGRAVTRDELTAVLYQRRATPYERSLDVHVSHLRRKLEAAGCTAIHTVRGVGYQFSAA